MIEKINSIETERFVTITLAACFAVFILSVTTCSIHMNTFNAGEEKTEAMKIKVQAEAAADEALAEVNLARQKNQGQIDLANQQHKAEMERLKVVERLIKEQNINPIAARCAVAGWSSSDNPVVCQSVASGNTQLTTRHNNE